MLMQNTLLTNTNANLLSSFKLAIRNSSKIKILAAFIMESGVRLILDDLIYALNKGAQIQILTGYYLGITEPSALYLLKMSLGESVDMRIFKHKSISFHPKTYIFQDEENGEIYIGSSNISMSALEYGVEWNYKIVKNYLKEEFNQFLDNFGDLFENHSFKLDNEALKEYSINWKKNRLFDDISKEHLEWKDNLAGDFIQVEQDKYEIVKPIKLITPITPITLIPPTKPIPYGAQIEALYHLNKTREDGMDKGLVVMATGVGKTYLAAFDCLKYKKILFIAHREEILDQAYKSFKKLMPEKSFGIFKASTLQNDAEVIFASVQTLGKESYLNESYFKPNNFDYIIIDEFHHVAANSYKGIVDYFKPKFLLGLTATPFRMDNKDIFEFCDDNLVYEINLKEAIERDYLVPFRYYGIYDAN